MSFAGLKKQFNKANQYMSEKLGNVKGSQLEEDFIELEKKTDAYNHLVDQLQHRTKEFLQPNPAARTKLNFQTAVLKARGQARGENIKYQQPESVLSETMVKAGAEIGDETPYVQTNIVNALAKMIKAYLENINCTEDTSNLTIMISFLGACVLHVGQSFSTLAEIKDALEMNVKQNFLDPLEQLQNKDLKEIMHHRKKLSGRRLDYDYKKKKGDKVTKEELRTAEDKFDESKELCYSSMMNLMDSDVEHIGQMHAFCSALKDYYKQCYETCEDMVSFLSDQMSEAASRPRAERKNFSRPHDDGSSDSGSDRVNFSTPQSISPPPSGRPSISRPVISAPQAKPQVRALYDFDKENEGELSFKENDIIFLTRQIDENWFEGELNGESGFFPINYVEVVVPL